MDIYDVFKIVINAALINCAVIFLQLFAHNYFGDPNFLIATDFQEINVPFRKPGLMAGYPHAGILSLIAIQFLLAFSKKWPFFKFIFTLIILWLSLMVTSRTSFILSLIPLIIFISSARSSKKNLSRLTTFLMLGTITVIFVLSLLPRDTFNVAFELFVNVVTEKKLSTYSSDALIDSYALPTSLTTWLFGNGKYMKNDLGYNVDDGYQIMLYGCGVLYTALNLLLFFSYAFFAKWSTTERFPRFLVYCVFLILLICNSKADVLFSRVISDILVLIVAVSIIKKRAERKAYLPA